MDDFGWLFRFHFYSHFVPIDRCIVQSISALSIVCTYRAGEDEKKEAVQPIAHRPSWLQSGPPCTGSIAFISIEHSGTGQLNGGLPVPRRFNTAALDGDGGGGAVLLSASIIIISCVPFWGTHSATEATQRASALSHRGVHWSERVSSQGPSSLLPLAHSAQPLRRPVSLCACSNS